MQTSVNFKHLTLCSYNEHFKGNILMINFYFLSLIQKIQPFSAI